MKRLTGIIAAATIALAPLSASALEVMNEKAMSDITAQAGVSIAIDDVILFQHVDETRYTDTVDDTGAGGGSIVISEKTALKTLNAIAPGLYGQVGDLSSQFHYDADGITDGTDTIVEGADLPDWAASPLTIDVEEAHLISVADQLGGGAGGITGVVIGLPTLEIHTTADSYTVGVVAEGADLENETTLIKIEKGASTLAILGGHVEIAPH